jgi:hypothetical protein
MGAFGLGEGCFGICGVESLKGATMLRPSTRYSGMFEL